MDLPGTCIFWGCKWCGGRSDGVASAARVEGGESWKWTKTKEDDISCRP